MLWGAVTKTAFQQNRAECAMQMTKPMKQVKTSFQIVKQNVSVSTVSLDVEKHKTQLIAKAKL